MAVAAPRLKTPWRPLRGPPPYALEVVALVGLWVLLPLAMVAHEGAHYLQLRRLRIHPRLTLGVMAVGWSFDPGPATAAQLRWMWLAGPLAESVVWASAAFLVPGWTEPCLIVMAVQLVSNLALPGTDGWRLGHSLCGEVDRPLGWGASARTLRARTAH